MIKNRPPYERLVSVKNDFGIFGFFGEHRWLSNFHDCEIELDGLVFRSTEAAYMAQKSLDPIVRNKFTEYSSKDSRKMGQLVELRPDWDKVRLKSMYRANQVKYFKHKDLREKLLETGNLYIEETNHWNDTFWGVCNGVGENYLGRIIMRIRSELLVAQEQKFFLSKLNSGVLVDKYYQPNIEDFMTNGPLA